MIALKSQNTAARQRPWRNKLRRNRIFIGMTVVGLLLARQVHSAPLDLKTGLWEHSVTTMTELTPSGKHDLSKVPPDARAKIERAMSGSVTTGRHTRVTQECVTPTMLEKWSAFAHNETTSPNCKRTVVNESAKRLKTTLSCDGGKSKGTVDFAVSGEQLKGSMIMVFHEPNFDRTVTQEIAAKWLRAACASDEQTKSSGAE